MNLPNFKDILKIVLEKLSVLKSDLSVLISVIITLLALLLFIPTQLFSSGLKKEMKEKSIDGLLTRIDRLKVISEKTLEENRELLANVVKEANSIELLAIQTTQRELLKYDLFNLDPNDPNTSASTSVFLEFGKQYCSGIDRFIEEHNANVCPTSEWIQEELENAGINNILQGGAVRRSFRANTSMEEDIQGIMADDICQKRAESTFVYIDRYQISGYIFWLQYQYNNWIEDIENCWYSQLGYWIIEDIFDTIIAMNDGHESLITAPVKRLMRIYFTDEFTYTEFDSEDSSKKYADRPKYVTTQDASRETLTGRYCNENYDVVHFGVKLVVSTDDLDHFFEQLCSAKEHKYIDKSEQSHIYKHNQITILGMTVKSIDMRSTEHELYRYGDANVSEVELTCEYIFNVKGYNDIMPQSVKDFFSGN